MRAAVLGSGSWGTALAAQLALNGHDSILWGRDLAEVEDVREHRENRRYLPGHRLPDSLDAQVLDGPVDLADLYVVAVPTHAVREVCAFLPQREPLVVVASKGLEPGGKLVSEVVGEVVPSARMVALSGPNLAIELMKRVPTAAVAASSDTGLADLVANAFNSTVLRVYLSDDLVGVELAGALKNVLAIGAGMSDGLGFGDNTKGALLARGLLEMTKLGVRCGAKPESFFGVSGVGDLIATAASKLSRNYRVGYGLGQGRSLNEILAEIGQVAEGVTTAESALCLAERTGVPTPIFTGIAAVLRGDLDPREGVARLMSSQPKREGFASIWSEMTVR